MLERRASLNNTARAGRHRVAIPAASLAGLAVVVVAAIAVANPDADVHSAASGRVDGVAAGDHLGTSVAGVGDVNRDGVDDYIAGAPGSDALGRRSAGSAYVIYGRSGRPPVELAGKRLGKNGFAIHGASPGDRAGFSVAGAGDVNGDRIDDVIVGAPNADAAGRSGGAAYVVYGRKARDLADVDLASLGVDGFEIASSGSGSLGYAVSGAGFFNGDRVADVVIGDRTAGGAGRAYVIYGQAGGGPSGLDVDRLGTSERARGMTVLGFQRFSRTGAAVAGGDFAGDRRSDVAVGAPSFDVRRRPGAGRVNVIYGSNLADPADVALSGLGKRQDRRGRVITGASATDSLGASLADAGDFNGDGRPDLIAGASGLDAGGHDSGGAYVFDGRGNADLDLADSGSAGSVTRIDGADGLDRAGAAVGAAGDGNRDGVDDVIVGAPSASPTSGADGAAYVVYGQAAPDPADVRLAEIASGGVADDLGFVIMRVQDHDLGSLGRAVGLAGDSNRDGRAEVLVGDPDFSGGRKGAGAVYAVSGGFELEEPDTEISGPVITDANPTFTFSSPTTGASFQCSLDGAGFTPCSSPYTLRVLSSGLHTLRVRAVAEGLSDPSPASQGFIVAGGNPPPPVQGETVNLRPISGDVGVGLADVGRRLIQISEPVQVPVGTLVDATLGRVEVTSATEPEQPGGDPGTQAAEFFEGKFRIRQTKRRDLTTMRLRGKTECSGPASPGRKTPFASRKRKPGLWGSGNGNFASQGNHGSAQVRGTEWLLFEACGGITGTFVKNGIVRFTDFYRDTTTLVGQGETAVARPLNR